MPYSTTKELPSGVKDNLPTGAQKIYMGAFNGAHKEGEDESSAAKIAWAAVKDKYRQAGDGTWLKKQFEIIDKTLATPGYIQGSPMVRENLDGGKKKKKPKL